MLRLAAHLPAPARVEAEETVVARAIGRYIAWANPPTPAHARRRCDAYRPSLQVACRRAGLQRRDMNSHEPEPSVSVDATPTTIFATP
jgi:hypothetical protein